MVQSPKCYYKRLRQFLLHHGLPRVMPPPTVDYDTFLMNSTCYVPQWLQLPAPTLSGLGFAVPLSTLATHCSRGGCCRIKKRL